VAEELYVTVDTVRKHLQNAYRKLGVTNRTAAALHVRA
jgi:DNA-binding NarL/FixJ family response regulator